MQKADFLVIGAGMAGASVAAELSRDASVILVEAEDAAGQHSTGRSAALFSEMYGNRVVRALTRASRRQLFAPPAGFTETPLVHPRGVMFIAAPGQVDRLAALAALPDIRSHVRDLSAADAMALCPSLRPGAVAAALHERDASDIEVDAVHQAYLRELRRNGGTVVTGRRIAALAHDGKVWTTTAAAGSFNATNIVNAAGAWADVIGGLAGAAPIGLQPCRRTAILVDPPAGADMRRWPMVIDADEQFYFKPDAGLLLLSPADETPTEPGDAQPDEWDIAVAVDRVTAVLDIQVRRIRHSWAGLRSFVADRTPVVGADPLVPGFFWLAAQGGYGIQCAPALARVAAALARGDAMPADIAALGVTAADLAPGRGSLRRTDAGI